MTPTVPTVPTQEPTRFAAGETVTWSRTVPGFPSSEWTLRYYLRGAGKLDIPSTAQADGSFLVAVRPIDTEKAPAGAYRWTAYAEKGSGSALERHPVGTGLVIITANLVTAAAGELQSHAEQMLAAIEARLRGRLTTDQLIESYGVAGRQVVKIAFEQLEIARRRYRAEVMRERNGGRLPRIEVGFGWT